MDLPEFQIGDDIFTPSHGNSYDKVQRDMRHKSSGEHFVSDPTRNLRGVNFLGRPAVDFSVDIPANASCKVYWREDSPPVGRGLCRRSSYERSKPAGRMHFTGVKWIRRVLVQLCQEDVKTSRCTEDEGGPFGIAR